MPRERIVDIIDLEQAVAAFVEQLRVDERVLLRRPDGVFELSLRRKTISAEGRAFLLKGGPDAD